MSAILLIWIGLGSSQTMAVDHFKTMDECHAAAAALRSHDRRLKARCIPYQSN